MAPATASIAMSLVGLLPFLPPLERNQQVVTAFAASRQGEHGEPDRTTRTWPTPFSMRPGR